MLYPNRRIEIWQVRMFVKQRRTHGWSSFLPGKNTFIPQQKLSNLYIIMFEVSENDSEYVFMHTAVACVHKCFTLTCSLKSGKCECLWSSAEHAAEAVTCRGKNAYAKARIIYYLHHMFSLNEKYSDSHGVVYEKQIKKCFHRFSGLFWVKTPKTRVVLLFFDWSFIAPISRIEKISKSQEQLLYLFWNILPSFQVKNSRERKLWRFFRAWF